MRLACSAVLAWACAVNAAPHAAQLMTLDASGAAVAQEDLSDDALFTRYEHLRSVMATHPDRVLEIADSTLEWRLAERGGKHVNTLSLNLDATDPPHASRWLDTHVSGTGDVYTLCGVYVDEDDKPYAGLCSQYVSVDGGHYEVKGYERVDGSPHPLEGVKELKHVSLHGVAVGADIVLRSSPVIRVSGDRAAYLAATTSTEEDKSKSTSGGYAIHYGTHVEHFGSQAAREAAFDKAFGKFAKHQNKLKQHKQDGEAEDKHAWPTLAKHSSAQTTEGGHRAHTLAETYDEGCSTTQWDTNQRSPSTEKKVLYARPAFSDNAASTVDNAKATTTMADVRQFYLDNSWGRYKVGATDFGFEEFTYSGSITKGENTYSVTKANVESGVLTTGDLMDKARRQMFASNPKVDRCDYDITGVILPKIDRYGWAGLAGGRNMWFNNNLGPGVTIHEYGHCVGIGHSRTWEAIVPHPGDPLNSTAPNQAIVNEYGSPYNVMGGGPSDRGHFSAYQKTARLNWGDADLMMRRITALSNDGEIVVYPHDQTISDGRVIGLRVVRPGPITRELNFKGPFNPDDLRDTSWEEYHVEFREQFADRDECKHGVHVLNEDDLLLDMQPQTTGRSPQDWPLQFGTTFTDCLGGVHITPTNFAACPDAPSHTCATVAVGTGVANHIITFDVPSAPIVAEVGEATTVTLSASSDDGKELTLMWEMGDGTINTGTSVTHTWNTAGVKKLDVTAASLDGAYAKAEIVVHVVNPGQSGFESMDLISAPVTINSGEDAVKVSHSSLPAHTDSFTITASVMIGDSDSTRKIFAKADNAGRTPTFGAKLPVGQNYVFPWPAWSSDADATGGYGGASSVGVDKTQAIHFAAVVRPDKVGFYIDGRLYRESNNADTDPISTNIADITLGADYNGNQPLNGQLMNARFFNWALDTSDLFLDMDDKPLLANSTVIAQSNGCDPNVASCADGLWNGDETGVDCGGVCGPCSCDVVTVDGHVGDNERINGDYVKQSLPGTAKLNKHHYYKKKGAELYVYYHFGAQPADHGWRIGTGKDTGTVLAKVKDDHDYPEFITEEWEVQRTSGGLVPSNFTVSCQACTKLTLSSSYGAMNGDWFMHCRNCYEGNPVYRNRADVDASNRFLVRKGREARWYLKGDVDGNGFEGGWYGSSDVTTEQFLDKFPLDLTWSFGTVEIECYTCHELNVAGATNQLGWLNGVWQRQADNYERRAVYKHTGLADAVYMYYRDRQWRVADSIGSDAVFAYQAFPSGYTPIGSGIGLPDAWRVATGEGVFREVAGVTEVCHSCAKVNVAGRDGMASNAKINGEYVFVENRNERPMYFSASASLYLYSDGPFWAISETPGETENVVARVATFDHSPWELAQEQWSVLGAGGQLELDTAVYVECVPCASLAMGGMSGTVGSGLNGAYLLQPDTRRDGRPTWKLDDDTQNKFLYWRNGWKIAGSVGSNSYNALNDQEVEVEDLSQAWTVNDGGDQIDAGASLTCPAKRCEDMTCDACLLDDACVLCANGARGQSMCMQATDSAEFCSAESTTCQENNVAATAPPTCEDGVQNGDEFGPDCGGRFCGSCAVSCSNGILDGEETGVDCGGRCGACSSGSGSKASAGLIVGIVFGLLFAIALAAGVYYYLQKKKLADSRSATNAKVMATEMSSPKTAAEVTTAPMAANPVTAPAASAWQPLTDPQSGATYYFNSQTNESTWEKPAGMP